MKSKYGERARERARERESERARARERAVINTYLYLIGR